MLSPLLMFRQPEPQGTQRTFVDFMGMRNPYAHAVNESLRKTSVSYTHLTLPTNSRV